MSMPPEDIIAWMAQEIWQAYVVETGQSLPAGLADKLAAALVESLGLSSEYELFTHNDSDRT